MTWTKLDDHFLDHPKIIAAGERAELLHIHGLIYANKHLTDGFIPLGAVKLLLQGPHHRAVERLVELSIWVRVAGGYQIHDFLDWNPSREQVITERKRNAARTAKSRGSNGVTNAIGDDAPSRPVPSVGSKEPVRDKALLGGTVPKGTTNGGLDHLSEHLERASRAIERNTGKQFSRD